VVELKSVTTASDIWSVGCLAVELLTGGVQAGGRAGCLRVCVWGGRCAAGAGTGSVCVRWVMLGLKGARGQAAAKRRSCHWQRGGRLGACASLCMGPSRQPTLTPPLPRTNAAGAPPYYELQPMSALYNIVQVPLLYCS
jgi:hypothetical protein